MQQATEFVRTRHTVKEEAVQQDSLLMEALKNPVAVTRELNNRSLYHFLQYFWPVVSAGHTFQPNWHIEFLCSELEKVANKVAAKEPRDYDLIVNVAPGSTKTIISSIMFPAWCWTKWHWMRFITASYSKDLALESAEYCRDLVRSPEFQNIYPDIVIKDDKDTKSNFKIVKKVQGLSAQYLPKQLAGGGRFSTSVGSTITGFHGDILIVDDPLNPKQAASEIELAVANRWMEETLPTRKTNKAVTTTVLIMQRLHAGDPTGQWLDKQMANVRHICLPAECRNYARFIQPPEMIKFYKDDLFDPVRMPWKVLNDMEAILGQYAYAGQFGQNPVPPGGGMFKVDQFGFTDRYPSRGEIVHTVRYWDKAGTQDGGAYTVGVKMSRLASGRYLVEDVRRGQWGTNERERIILQTAEIDGFGVEIGIEQEPGPIWEEELVQMANGHKKILKDIVENDLIINGQGESAKVLAVHSQGELPILKITTDSGRIIHTAHSHPFLTPNGWSDAKTLEVGDVLALKTNNNIEVTSFPSLEECRLAGYFVGDGCCTWCRGREITCNSNIVSSDPIEGEDIKYCAEKLGFNVHVGGSRGWTYYLSNGVKDWLKFRGLAGKNTFQKRIPEWVLRANNECLANFLGAYFACDGSVMNKTAHPCVEYYSANLPLIQDTQSALLRFGIYTMLRKRNYSEEVQRTRRPCYRITTRRSDGAMGKFAKYIPVYGVKGGKLKVFKQLNFEQPYLPDPIISIEKVGDLPCKCLEISKGESFLANDIVVHNSGGLESAQNTIRNLAGYIVKADKPTGDKATRADPFSVQVNNGNVILMRAEWNRPYLNELRFFPFSTTKDQVDASSGSFAKLVGKKIACRIV